MSNCGCRKCGLRGISKNVMTRSVFPRFDGLPIVLESYERQVKARRDPDNPEKYLFGTDAKDWSKEDAPDIEFADFLIEYLKRPEAKPEHLKILLCIHDWVQDEGTATV